MKVVINACFGGFGLSPRAFSRNDLFGPQAYRVETVDGLPESQRDWATMTREQRAESSAAWSAISIPDREIARDDKDLVAVVEELGSAASGRCANLQVVEIPDDVQWTIEEYDGSEHVAEVHRTWS